MDQQTSTSSQEPTKPTHGGTVSTETITLEVETTTKGTRYIILTKDKYDLDRENPERYLLRVK